MKLFERIRQELFALGFSSVDEESYFEDGNDQFSAVKDGVKYYFSDYWRDFELDGPHELCWGRKSTTGEYEYGTIRFTVSNPGKGEWFKDETFYIGHYIQGEVREILEIEAESPELAVDRAEEMFEDYFPELDEAGRTLREHFVATLKEKEFVALFNSGGNLLYLSPSYVRIDAALPTDE